MLSNSVNPVNGTDRSVLSSRSASCAEAILSFLAKYPEGISTPGLNHHIKSIGFGAAASHSLFDKQNIIGEWFEIDADKLPSITEIWEAVNER